MPTKAHFARPHRPRFPGQEAFRGRILHAAEYRNPLRFRGKRLVVVGAGDSAVQIAHELVGVAEITLATRTPIRFMPQVVLGRDLHFWLTVCDDANEACPFFPWAREQLHWSFEDPSKAEGTEEERLAVFRSV